MSKAAACVQVAGKLSNWVNGALDQFDTAVMPRERVSFMPSCWTPVPLLPSQSWHSASLCAGGYQRPNIDGLVPGSVSVVQHAALPCICASVQCCWVPTYQGDDEALNAQWLARTLGLMLLCTCPLSWSGANADKLAQSA